MMKKIFIVAGEASSDSNAAALVRELNGRRKDIEFFGVGGTHLRAEGMRIDVDAEKLSVVGLWDWAERWIEILDAYRKVRQTVDRERIDCALLLDLPDLNLRLAKRLKTQNIPVVYYTPPQVWAWRKYRIESIRRSIERVLVVFPFERDFYAKEGVRADFVGHPLKDSVRYRSHFRSQTEIERAPRVALLPGSRRSEARNHIPILLDCVKKLRETYPAAMFRLPIASTLNPAWIEELCGTIGGVQFTSNSLEALEWADIAIVASGTATLETSLIGTPFCLIYKMSRSTSFAVQHIFRYRGFLGLPNVLSGKKIVSEFLHGDAESESIVSECLRMIQDAEYRAGMVDALSSISSSLGLGGASIRAADAVEEILAKELR